MKNVILLTTCKSDNINLVLERYFKLKNEVNDYDVILCFHDLNNDIPTEYIDNKDVSLYVFDNTILNSIGLTPLENGIMPGSNHFPLIKFARENPIYWYYWVMEDDVVFNGDWSILFDAVKNDTSDLLTSKIRNYTQDKSWYWWQFFHDKNDMLKNEDLWASFNTIYRISNRGVKMLDYVLSQGMKGHYETLFPTILINNGLTVKSFNEFGDFYTDETNRFRPEYNEIGENNNMIYHPLKIK